MNTRKKTESINLNGEDKLNWSIDGEESDDYDAGWSSTIESQW